MARELAPEIVARVHRLSDPRDHNNTAKLAKVCGISVGCVRRILNGQQPSSNRYTKERAAKQKQDRDALAREHEARWQEVKEQARVRVEAGEDLASIAVDLGVSMLRLKGLRRDARNNLSGGVEGHAGHVGAEND